MGFHVQVKLVHGVFFCSFEESNTSKGNLNKPLEMLIFQDTILSSEDI
jgi:hypothetical protein